MSKYNKYVGIALRKDLRQAPFRVLKDWVTGIPREARAIAQRGWRGYAKEDTWDLGNYMAEWLPSAIRQLRDESHGYPCEMEDMIASPIQEGEYDVSLDYKAILWANILTDMADGFEAFDYCVNSRFLEEEHPPSPEFNLGEDFSNDPFILWLDENRERHNALVAEKWEVYKNGMALFAEFFPNLWD